MSFECIDCAPEGQRWRFDIPMSISVGPCETCRKTGRCIDVK